MLHPDVAVQSQSPPRPIGTRHKLCLRYILAGPDGSEYSCAPRRYQVLDILIGRGQNGPNGRDKVGLGSIRRPVIGLVLGGGAARGFAHIGVLRTLIAHGIVPNVVVGTSIGAVVGGAYAAGHLDTLEGWARSLQLRNILGYLYVRLNGSGLIGG